MKKTQWTKENCAIEALKYQTRTQFQKGCQSAYQASYKKGWLNDICAHMKLQCKPVGYWSYERCACEAMKYQQRYQFQKANPTAYIKASNYGWLDDICKHMPMTRTSHSFDWTYELCNEEAKKYESRRNFKRGSPGAYFKAMREGWLDTICSHIPKKYESWTKEKCFEEAAKYNTKSSFIKGRAYAYNVACRNGWLDDILQHIHENNNKMSEIKIKELEDWFVNYITDFIHGCESEDNEKFNQWAKGFKREEAEFVVGMEYIVDWAEEEREFVPVEEAKEWAMYCIKKILNVWYL